MFWERKQSVQTSDVLASPQQRAKWKVLSCLDTCFFLLPKVCRVEDLSMLELWTGFAKCKRARCALDLQELYFFFKKYAVLKMKAYFDWVYKVYWSFKIDLSSVQQQGGLSFPNVWRKRTVLPWRIENSCCQGSGKNAQQNSLLGLKALSFVYPFSSLLMFDHVVANDVWVYRGILNSTLLHCLLAQQRRMSSSS